VAADLAQSVEKYPESAMFSTVEFLPFGLDWIRIADVRFSKNKDLSDNNDPPRRQKV
jgi:hypothetical protein